MCWGSGGVLSASCSPPVSRKEGGACTLWCRCPCWRRGHACTELLPVQRSGWYTHRELLPPVLILLNEDATVAMLVPSGHWWKSYGSEGSRQMGPLLSRMVTRVWSLAWSGHPCCRRGRPTQNSEQPPEKSVKGSQCALACIELPPVLTETARVHSRNCRHQLCAEEGENARVSALLCAIKSRERSETAGSLYQVVPA